jgi:sortase A
MKKRRGSIMIALGVLLILGALGLAGYNVLDARRAAQDADLVQVRLEQQIERNKTAKTAPLPGQQRLGDEMPVEEIDGRRYIGTIEIPALNKKLPVLEDWSYANLKISPCRYSGSYYTDDMVLCAHNYASHFNGLRWIDPGEEVIFTTADGVEYRYIITYRETLFPTEVERLLAAEQDCDLTLFTCYIGGRTRCVVRCVRV